MPLKQQLNLFPLHPENLVQQDKDLHDDHVAFLFETATDTSTTLHGLLSSTTTTSTTTSTSEEGQGQHVQSPSLPYRGSHDQSEEEERCGGASCSLVRTAMRCKERDASEERWVSYWEVVKKKEQEEVSSCCGGAADASEKMMMVRMQGDQNGPLVGLKLDYQEILNAWSDKGPLFIDGELPQTVPDLQDGSNV